MHDYLGMDDIFKLVAVHAIEVLTHRVVSALWNTTAYTMGACWLAPRVRCQRSDGRREGDAGRAESLHRTSPRRGWHLLIGLQPRPGAGIFSGADTFHRKSGGIACLLADWHSLIKEAVSMKKAKIVAALMALASFVLSAGAFITWK